MTLRDRLQARMDLVRSRRGQTRLPPSWLDDPVAVAGMRQAVRAFWAAVLDAQRERLWWVGQKLHPRYVAESLADLDLGARVAVAVLGFVLLVAALTLVTGLVWILTLGR